MPRDLDDRLAVTLLREQGVDQFRMDRDDAALIEELATRLGVSVVVDPA